MDTQLLRFILVEDLADKFTCADGGGIRLGDADDIANRLRRDARADASVAGKRRGGGHHRINAEVGILQRAELSLEQNIFVLGERLPDKGVGVADKRGDFFPIGAADRHQLILVKQGLVIDVLERQIFQHADIVELFAQRILIKQLVELDAALGEFIAEKRRNAAFGGAVGVFAEPLLFIGVQQNMVRHQKLHPVGDEQLRVQTRLAQVVQFPAEFVDVQCHAVADDAGDVIIADAAGHQMQRKASVFVDNGVSRICAALESDDNIRLLCKHIGDLSLAFIAPVGADNCSNHMLCASLKINRISGPYFIISYYTSGVQAFSKIPPKTCEKIIRKNFLNFFAKPLDNLLFVCYHDSTLAG